MFSFFESPTVKEAKMAAQAAGLLRQQAADKLTIELGMLKRAELTAHERIGRLSTANSADLNHKDFSILRKVEDFQAKVGRLSWALKELSEKHDNANRQNSATAYDEVQSFELELRDGFATLLQETTELIHEAYDLNMRCDEYLKNLQ